MDRVDVTAHWVGNADTWMALSHEGADPHRDMISTPAFLDALPDVRDGLGLDIGCADGFNTVRILERCRAVVGIDPVPTFVEQAKKRAVDLPGATFVQGSVTSMDFESDHFDFATAVMSWMDIPDAETGMRETARVLKPGGFLQASVEHPLRGCERRRWIRDAAGARKELAVSGYFEQGETVDHTTFRIDDTPVSLAIPRFRRTLSGWIDLFLGAGFAIEAVIEPRPPRSVPRDDAHLGGAALVPYYLIIRGRLAADGHGA